MAYQALYRKYRPKNFEEVVGQTHIIKTLSNAIKNNRIAHAYLFCGPRGTGKTSTAKIFAKMLNCTSENHKPCEECINCQMFNNGSHPDIIEIDAASNNGVDEVRNLIDKVKYAPMEGKYKVYIIDEVHMMTSGAFNALLKTIEEPPEHIVFIFATTEPNKVLPTIISRCQRYDFNRVADPEIVKRLKYVCEQENIQTDENTLQLIAELSDGGMRDSLSILDQCVAYCSDVIHEEDVRTIYGIFSIHNLGELFNNLNSRKIEDTIQQLQNAKDKGIDLKKLTSDLIRLLKESIIYDYSPQTTLVSDVHKQILRSYFMNSNSNFRMDLLEELMNTYNKFGYASNVLDYLESALLKVSLKYDENNHMNMNLKNHKNEYEKEISSYDLPSESTEIPSKSAKIEPIIENPISDVSRETLKPEKSENSDKKEFKKKDIILNDEFILQLLAGSEKQFKIKDTEKFQLLENYLYDLEYGKYANSLKAGKIFASASTYMIISVSSSLEAKAINEIQTEEGYEKFMKLLIGTEKKIFAIDNEQQKNIVSLFIKRKKEGTLPEPIQIEIIKKSVIDELEDKNNPLSLFENLKIVND